MEGRAARRWMTGLLVHPLMATVLAVDLAWVLLGRQGWEAPIYTAGVTVVALALAVSMHRVRRVPRVASLVALFLVVALTNAVLMMSGALLVRLGRPLPTVAVLCLAMAAVAVVLTFLIAGIAERAAHRRTHPVEADPATADLIDSTLVDLPVPTAAFSRPEEQPTRIMRTEEPVGAKVVDPAA